MKRLILMFTILLITTSSLTYAQQKVKASYYADFFHGRQTASGNYYHRDSLTCAHKTLPFGTILKIVNPKNKKTVYVTVTDRGPFIKGRSIDLSYAAAKKLGTIKCGVATVIYTKVKHIEKEIEDPVEKPIERIEVADIENLQKIELSPEDFLIPQDNTVFINEHIKLAPLVKRDYNGDSILIQVDLFPSKKVILRALNLLPGYLPRQKRLIVC